MNRGTSRWPCRPASHTGRVRFGTTTLWYQAGLCARLDLHRFASGMRSPARRRRLDGLRLAGAAAARAHPSPPRITTCPPSTSTSRSPTRCHAPRWRRCAGAEFGIRLHSMGDIEQGNAHVVGPQLGLTYWDVCGDSHTNPRRIRRVGRWARPSEVEHVLATQTPPLRPFQHHGGQRR